MRLAWLSRLTAAMLLGSIIALGVGRWYTTEHVRTAIESCQHTKTQNKPIFDYIVIPSLNILANRTTWIVYYITAAIILNAILLGFVGAMSFLRSSRRKPFVDHDVAPYWFKLTRAIMILLLLFFSFTAFTIAKYTPYDFLYSTTRLDASVSCAIPPSSLHATMGTLVQCLTTALTLASLGCVWGFLWSLESVSQFIVHQKSEPTA